MEGASSSGISSQGASSFGKPMDEGDLKLIAYKGTQASPG
jgi:hypothetical protein